MKMGVLRSKSCYSRNMSNLMILAKMHVIIVLDYFMNDECSAYATNVND